MSTNIKLTIMVVSGILFALGLASYLTQQSFTQPCVHKPTTVEILNSLPAPVVIISCKKVWGSWPFTDNTRALFIDGNNKYTIIEDDVFNSITIGDTIKK